MKFGFVASAFDLLHPGHLVMLEECRNNCDRLIVGLHTNPNKERPTSKESPVETTFERYIRLKSCKYVDEIIPYDTEMDLHNILALLKPEIRFLGTDYKEKRFTGDDLNIEIYWIARDHCFSSSSLRGRLRNSAGEK